MASQLTKAQIGALLQGAYGQFEYKIRWKLTAPLANNADGVIVQKVTIKYSIKDAQDQAIDISTYTNNNCMWETHKECREAWYIWAGMLQPTYVGDNPSFDQTIKLPLSPKTTATVPEKFKIILPGSNKVSRLLKG